MSPREHSTFRVESTPSPWQDDIEPDIGYPVKTEENGYLVVQYAAFSRLDTNRLSMRTALTKLDRDGNVIWTKPVDEEEYMRFCEMMVYDGKTVLS